MRWLLITMLVARVAHADCDVEPRTDYSVFMAAQRVVDRPPTSRVGDKLTPNFTAIGARWELGAEFNCEPTRLRLAFAASVRSESERASFGPDDYQQPPYLATRARVQLGGELEIAVRDGWWVHAGAEKALTTGFELAVGARLRNAVTWVGADLVMTTPTCADCIVTPAVGLQVSGGLEGRSDTAAYVSVAAMAAVALIGGVVYIMSNCDC